MPKQERRLKYQEMPATARYQSSISNVGAMVHNSLSGRGEDDCHSQYVLKTFIWPSVRVTNSANQSIANNDDEVVVTFDTELWDDYGFHSTTSNTSRLTVPLGYAGTYLIVANAQFEAAAAGQRIYSICYNGALGQPIAQVQSTNNTAANRMASQVTTIYQLDEDDYVEFRVYQNSGGALDIRAVDYWSPLFHMIWMGGK